MKDRQPPQGPKVSATAGKDKVLYTLVNGQVKKVPDAGIDLIPGVAEDDEKLSKKQKKKLKRQLSKEQADQAVPVPSPAAAAAGVVRRPEPRVPPTGQPPAPLPVNGRGRIDLDRLSLPPGISISKIQGEVPERKFFPSRAEPPPPAPAVIPSAPLMGGLPQSYGGLSNPAHVINPGSARGFPANGKEILF